MKLLKRILAGVIAITICTSGFATSVCAKTDKKVTTEYPKLNLSFAVNGTDTQIDTKVGQYLAELVSKKSGGNITIDVFPNDTLAGGNATKGIEYVCAGATDLAAYATSTLSAIDPKLNIATMPWTFSDYDEAEKTIKTTGGEYYKKRLSKKKLNYLGAFHNGFRQLTNSKHAVTEPKDLKGLKIRIPGSKIYMDFWEAVGASPTAMSWSEVFTAIQQGTIDGQENGAPITQSSKMYEVQKYMTVWNYAYDCDLIVCNTEVWNSMNKATQELLRECIEEACDWGNETIKKEEKEIINDFKEEGMQVDYLSEEQLTPFKELIKDSMNKLKVEYGKEACEAFGINTDGVKFKDKK